MLRKRLPGVAAVIALTIATAMAKSILVPMIGTGVVRDDDRDAAAGQAGDTAEENANISCLGALVNVIKTPPICLGNDDDGYKCTVVVKASCRIGN